MVAFFSKKKKYVLGGAIIIIAIAIAAWIIFFALQKRSHGNVVALPNIAPPAGWYAHHLTTVDSSFIIFTRDQVFSVKSATELGAYGEQIDADVATTTFSPKDYIANEGFFGDPAGQVFDSNWSVLGDLPLFTIRGEDAEGEDFKAEFLFASSTVYNVNLSPDDANDYGDLEKIVKEVSQGLH